MISSPDSNSAEPEKASLMQGIGRRIGVHICALFLAFLFTLGSRLPIDRLGLIFYIYVGLICLVPRGNIREMEWYVPTATGLVQCAVLAALGLYWPLIFFWGGLQTWLQRLFRSRGALGWEWVVAPILAITLYCVLSDTVATRRITLLPLVSFPIISAIGYVICRILSHRKLNKSQRQLLISRMKTLQTLSSEKLFPQELRQQIELLHTQSQSYNQKMQILSEEQSPLVIQIADITKKLENIVKQAKKSGWPPDTREMLVSLRTLNDTLLKELRSAPEESAGTGDTLDSRMILYEKSAQDLLMKVSQVPESMREHVEGIASSTMNILRCMQSDPQDREPGDKFLYRYLKTTHKVVDEHIRLSKENVQQQDVAAALAQSEDILARLNKAFKDEHANLLQNDAVDYTAELNTVDTLLKMRGH